jgi:hypothetical protein
LGIRRSSRPLCDRARSSACPELIGIERSGSFWAEQRLVTRQTAAHLGERAAEKAGDVGLGDAERRRHLRLRALEEEPLEHDPPLTRVERPRCARHECAVEPELLERG